MKKIAAAFVAGALIATVGLAGAATTFDDFAYGGSICTKDPAFQTAHGLRRAIVCDTGGNSDAMGRGYYVAVSRRFVQVNSFDPDTGLGIKRVFYRRLP